jgi:hypothetical protein
VQQDATIYYYVSSKDGSKSEKLEATDLEANSNGKYCSGAAGNP